MRIEAVQAPHAPVCEQEIAEDLYAAVAFVDVDLGRRDEALHRARLAVEQQHAFVILVVRSFIGLHEDIGPGDAGVVVAVVAV